MIGCAEKLTVIAHRKWGEIRCDKTPPVNTIDVQSVADGISQLVEMWSIVRLSDISVYPGRMICC